RSLGKRPPLALHPVPQRGPSPRGPGSRPHRHAPLPPDRLLPRRPPPRRSRSPTAFVRMTLMLHPRRHPRQPSPNGRPRGVSLLLLPEGLLELRLGDVIVVKGLDLVALGRKRIQLGSREIDWNGQPLLIARILRLQVPCRRLGRHPAGIQPLL